MKLLGTKIEDDSRIVEMTKDEYLAFRRLESAVDGAAVDGAAVDRNRYTLPDVKMDFSGVLGAIEAFLLAKFGVNRLRQTVDDLDCFLKEGK